MTYQIAIPAESDSIVLASDMKLGVWNPADPAMPPKEDVYASKVCFGGPPHHLAVAFSGEGRMDSEMAQGLANELTAYLSTEKAVCGIAPEIAKWGKKLFADITKGETQDRPAGICSVLVINPRAQRNYRLCKLRVNYSWGPFYSREYLINGDERNAAVFWPKYLRIGILPPEARLGLDQAIELAATTILTASKLDPERVGGMEIHCYHDERWEQLPDVKVDAIESRFERLHSQLQKMILAPT